MDPEKQNNGDHLIKAPEYENSSIQEVPQATLAELIDKVADRFEPIVKIIQTVAESNLKSRQSDSKFRIHMAWIAAVVVTVIVGVATFLTFNDKMDGSTYGFLLGLIVGYVLTFIRDAIRPIQNKE